MHIYCNYSFSKYFNEARERILPVLSPLQKKIVMVAGIIFSLSLIALGAVYCIRLCTHKNRKKHIRETVVDDIGKKLVGVEGNKPPKEEAISIEPAHYERQQARLSSLSLDKNSLKEAFEIIREAQKHKHMTLEQAGQDYLYNYAGKIGTLGGFKDFIQQLNDNNIILRKTVIGHSANDEWIQFLPLTVESLTVVCCEVSNTGIKRLSSTLRELTIEACPRITDANSLPKNLQKLCLKNEIATSPAFFKYLPRTLEELGICLVSGKNLEYLPPTLRHLDLSVSGIIDEDLKKLPKKLVSLNLYRCDKITNAGLKDLPRTIQELDLSYCYRITAAGLKDLPRMIRNLILVDCINIEDEGLKDMPPALKHLDLATCDRITSAGLKFLPRTLEFLNLRGCKNITEEDLKKLTPELQEIIHGIKISRK